MKRTTVFLDPTLLKRAKQYANARGKSLAAVVREAVAQYINAPARPPGVPRVAGQFASDHSDTAERVDEFLWQDPHR
jgi:hypothetical protein